MSLNRFDWRFLLPCPPRGFSRMLLLGSAPGMARQATELGIAETVIEATSGSDSVDAAVVLNGAGASIADIAARLRPGGIVYFEGSRTGHPPLNSPRRVTRALAQAGLPGIRSWAIRPGLTARRAFLPLESREALRWYLSTFRAADTARSTGMELAARALLASTGQHGRGLTSSFAVVAATGPKRPLAPSVLGRAEVSSVVGCEDVRTILLTYGGDRIVFLPFGRGPLPLAVVKVPRLAAFNERTVNEQRMLLRLQDCDSRLRDSVPKPLGLLRCGDIEVAVESFCGGTPILRSTRQWGRPLRRKLSDLRIAARWLTDFHRQTELSRSPWSEADAQRWIGGPFERYGQEFGLTEAEERLFLEARSYSRALGESAFPVVWHHRDFKPSHVFRSNGALAVIDWEGARPGPPLCDLIHFFIHWHSAVRRTSGVQGAARLFFGPDRDDAISRCVREARGEYLHALSLDARFVPLLLVYTAVELALRRAEQQRLQGEARATPRSGNREFRLVEVLASHVRELFSDRSGQALVA